MEVREYVDSMKNIQKCIIAYIGNEADSEEEYQNLIKIIDDKKIREDPLELRTFLCLIVSIFKEHHKTPIFTSKFEKILLTLKEEIKKFFSNSQIFDIFKKSKRLLLFLFEEKILEANEYIADIMKTRKMMNAFYPYYFYPEVKAFLKNKALENKINHAINDIEKSNSDTYEKMRKEGENESTICKLIREDSIEEFIIYVNQNDLSISSCIQKSIFETNYFLFNKNLKLIEYSAFYGSMQIFKYLYKNEETLEPSIWLFAIHGQNPEMISFLEEMKVIPNDKTYQKCLLESIRCHHFEISEYIKSNLMINHEIDNYSNSFKYFNFIYFPEKLNDEASFYYLCKYNYISLVKLLLKNKNIDINEKTIKINSFENRITLIIKWNYICIL